MTEDGKQPKGKSPQDIARWRAMRANVLPNHLVKPVGELEAAIETLEPLLKPRTTHEAGFAARHARPVAVEERRAEFEAVIAKADALCRYLRMEQTMDKKDYDTPKLQPMLDTLHTTASIADELHGRRLLADNFRATSARMQTIDRMRAVIREAADAFGAKVNVDTLWNAYRLDFQGKNKQWLTVEELEDNPFVATMERTSERLRHIAQVKAMERLARNLASDDVGDEIIAQKVKGFMAKLHPRHLLKTADFERSLDTLLYPEDRKDGHRQARTYLANKLRCEAMREFAYYRVERDGAPLHAGLLKDYHTDVTEYLKPQQLTLFDAVRRTDKDLAVVMETAPHLRNEVNYLRAEAALRKMDKLLEQHWRAASDMYPSTQQHGRGQGG